MQHPPDPKRSTPQWLIHWARRTPDAAALVVDGHPLTYRQLATLVAQSISALRDLGVEKGKLVGVICPYQHFHVALVLACHAIGATTLSLPEQSLSADVATCQRCDVLLVPPSDGKSDFHPRAIHLSPSLLRDITRLPVLDFGELNTRMADDDIIMVARSSGTTGRPKLMPLAVHIWNNRCWHPSRYILEPGTHADFIVTGSFDVLTYLHRAIVYLNLGRTVRIPPFANIPDAVARSSAAHVVISAAYARAMIDTIDPARWTRKAHRIDFVGADAPPSLKADLLRVATENVYEAYGSNEMLTAAYGFGEPEKTIFPDVNIRIRDERGAILPVGEIGAIEVSSNLVVSGYLDDPALSAALFQDGWHRTPDMGYMPAPGKLVVIGRGDDILNVGGTKVSPYPIENQIKAIPAIVEAVLINVPKSGGLEDLWLCVEKASGPLTQGETEQITGIINRAAFQPEFRIRQMTTFPRTDSNKVKRNELRQALAART